MKKNNVTKSKYWKYINKASESNIITSIIKPLLENTFDIKISKKENFNNSFETSSYPKSKKGEKLLSSKKNSKIS